MDHLNEAMAHVDHAMDDLDREQIPYAQTQLREAMYHLRMLQAETKPKET
jgi:hypothetical protein